MNPRLTVLVTGAGSLLGQGILRALRASSLRLRIIAVDPSPLSAGLYWAEAAHLIPTATEPGYLPSIGAIFAQEKPDAVLIGTDVELGVLAQHRERIEREFSTNVIVSDPRVVAIADDKWKSYEFFKANGFDCPESCLPGDEDELIARVDFPLIVKPRVGARSVGVELVRDRQELRRAVSAGRRVIIQECVGTPQDEYTAGALYFDGHCSASIVMRRELRDGNTYRAFADEYPELNRQVARWTERLRPYGPVNFQFRLAAGRAKVFEINARFSGTTGLRYHAGFNSVEMTLRRVLFGERVVQPRIKPVVILRHWEETVLRPEALLSNDSRNTLGNVKAADRFDVLRTAQEDQWLSVLRRCSAMYDVYHLPGYHAVAERCGEGDARLFAYQQGGYVIALPLILRTLADLPGIGASANTWRDATSVYGYTGPICSHKEMPRAVIDGFQDSLIAALQELQVVSVFSRLHPLLPDQTTLLQGIGDHELGGTTVSINLSNSPAEQRTQYDGAIRNRLNRQARSGITCALDPMQRHLPDFVALYYETMRRVKAEESYFFEPTYFSDLAESLGPMLKLFVVKMPDGEVISGGLFTVCEGIVQYHLGGTRDTVVKLSPIVLLLETVRHWANENGAHTFHLGGGVGAKTDSLFQFKARFSRQRRQFTTWRWVVAPEAYRELLLQKERWNSKCALRAISASFFPAYRCPAEPDTVRAALSAPRPGVVAPNEIQVAQNG